MLGNPNLPNNLAIPIGSSTAPTGQLFLPQPQHSSDMTNSVRRMTDTDLTLYPLSKFSVRLSYSQNIMQGPSLLPVRSGGVIKYNSLMEQYLRRSTDEYAASLNWNPVKGTRVTYEQRIHHFKENSYVTLDPNGFLVQEADGTPAYLGNWDATSNGSTSATTVWAPYSTAACNSNSISSATTVLYPAQGGGKPIIDPSCAVVTSYQRSEPIRTTMPSESLRFQSSSIKNLIMNGQAGYSRMKMNMPNFYENGLGLNGTTRQEYYTAASTGIREVYNADLGVIWQLTSKFDLEDQVTLSANAQPGNTNTSGYTKLVTGTAAGQETINYTGTLTSSVTNSGVATGEVYGLAFTYFGNEQLVNNLTAAWTVTPKFNAALTYRYGNRNIGLNTAITAATPTRTIFAITEQGVILNAAYRVTSDWDINGTVEASYDDNAFTTMSPRQLRHYRVHTKFRPAKWALFTAAYTDMERHNNTNNAGFAFNYGPLNHIDYSRIASVSGVLTPGEHFALNFDYAYDDVYTATNICFANQDSGFILSANPSGANSSSYFAGAAFLTPAGAPSTCATSATNPVPTQWYGRAFMAAPTQHGSVGVDLTPSDKLKYGVGYRVSSVAGHQFFTDARAVNGAMESTYETPYLNVAWTVHPGLDPGRPSTTTTPTARGGPFRRATLHADVSVSNVTAGQHRALRLDDSRDGKERGNGRTNGTARLPREQHHARPSLRVLINETNCGRQCLKTLSVVERTGNFTMSKTIRSGVALAAVILLAGAVSFAQSSGEAIYKSKCQSCHGAEGTPNPGIAKAMGVKPASDPSVKSMTEAQMIAATANGKGKMTAFKGKITDAQIKDSVDYFRTFAK